MTPDLRVALSLWLNAYEAALAIDRLSNDAARLKQLPGVIKALTETSAELHRVADTAVEDAPNDEGERLVREADGKPLKHVYAVPAANSGTQIVRVLAEWDEAKAELEAAETPSRAMFNRVDRLESYLKRFVATCRRNAKKETA